MWRMVDRIRIPRDGYALVVAPDGRLIAHGDPAKKALVAQSDSFSGHPLVGAGDPPPALEYVDAGGREQLAVAHRIPDLGWTVVVEQPTSDAYANAAALQRQLVIAIGVALLVMIGLGLLLGRRLIAPIFTLQRGTQALAAGDLESRVAIATGDEFEALGGAFNAMADRLVELQENVKRQERQAMFGRLAAGLVHDLSHPIQNLGNSTRLLMRDDLDAESRVSFARTIERELATLKRFMEDLRNVVKPKPVERFPLDVNGAVSEVVDSTRAEGEGAGVAVEGRYADGPLLVNGDRFALGRVFRNLVTNGIQATPPGGRVVIATSRVDGRVEIRVTDTGSGIPADRIGRIFDDFVTTKRRGLGLGLAIAKRIVEQLDGTIEVESEVGRGTSFTLRFPASAAVAARAEAS
jgi:signal transduction histidine kinase